jgi:hypothetical protein
MNIGIFGAGISGLHLALRLQQFGVDTTVYSTKTLDQMRAGPPVNFVGRFGRTRARERALGVAHHWAFPGWEMETLRMTIAARPPLKFEADLARPASAVDFRIYLPQLLEDYAARGGSVVTGPIEAQDIHRRSAVHDLVVVASGNRSIGELFPRDATRSAFTQPQRRIYAGLYHGIANAATPGADYQIVPGAGEILRYPFLSPAGKVSILGFEAVPGGGFEHLTRLPHAEDPVGFQRALLDTLATYAPDLRARIADHEFGLARPIDAMQGAVTPVVRQGWAALEDGKYAIAIGDAWVVNDPLTGQGANLGSHCAFQLAEAIGSDPPFDQRFCEAVEAKMWFQALAVTEWTTMFLQPPPAYLQCLFFAAATDERVAHAFLNNFDNPPAMWNAIASADRAASFLARVTGQPLARAS